eukprot:4556108-Prymnesium_polylepis.1
MLLAHRLADASGKAGALVLGRQELVPLEPGLGDLVHGEAVVRARAAQLGRPLREHEGGDEGDDSEEEDDKEHSFPDPPPDGQYEQVNLAAKHAGQPNGFRRRAAVRPVSFPKNAGAPGVFDRLCSRRGSVLRWHAAPRGVAACR